jgi:heat shock protein HslJ
VSVVAVAPDIDATRATVATVTESVPAEPGSLVRRPCGMTRSLFFLLAGAILLVACSGAGASSAPAAGIDGRTFLSTQVTGVNLVPGTQVRLTFTERDLSAQAGCNILGGTYSIEGDRLRTTQMFMTEMGCDGPRQAQDEWLAAFLGNVTFALDGDTLVLTDGTVRLTLMDKEVVTPDQTLEGTRWVLVGIVSGDAVSSVPVGVTASITISDGRVDVEAGCNMGGGPVAVSTDTLTFGPIATTKMACEAGPASVETAVLGVLRGSVDYTINADVLAISSGINGLTFRAAP